MAIMSFHSFHHKFMAHFDSMTKDAAAIYRVDFDPDVLWNLYLDSFPAGTNPVYRVRREFDCSYCRHFIKTMGGVVAIRDNRIETIWDFDTTSPECYQPVVDALSVYVKSKPIKDVFLTHEPTGGTGISQKNDKLVWDMLFKMLECRMQAGCFTVIDATNSKTTEMNRYKALAKQYRYRIYVVDMTDLPIAECKRRNANREESKRVPEAVIDKMYARFATQKIPAGLKVLTPDNAMNEIAFRKEEFQPV